jgi:sugar phosphate isomerase/epimerase
MPGQGVAGRDETVSPKRRSVGREKDVAVKLGTVAAIGFAEFEPEQWLACFRALGCTVVQAYRNQTLKVSLAQMREAIASGGMPCDSLHGVFGEEFDPSAPDETVRRYAVNTYKAEGDLALALGGPLVVVHCSTIRRDGVDPQERAVRVKQLKKSIAELGRFGEENDVQYAFENLPNYHPVGWDVGELAGILSELGAPNTGMCFDAGHANMVGDAVASLADAADRMIYLHLSDNSGRSDAHEMPTYGTMDMDAFGRKLYAIGYSGTAMLEVFYSVDKLRKLLDEGCDRRLARIVDLANGRE